MGKPNDPRPEDAYTGVTPGWQSGVGASEPIPPKDKARIKQTEESSSASRPNPRGRPRSKPA
jgi:hypothetical protein